MLSNIRAQLKLRPWWMNGLLLFCAFMTFLYVPWDIFIKPLSQDQEVWFGLLFTGWSAKFGAVLHWCVYGAGTWGFWKMRPWMHPGAALYALQIALGMLIWSSMDERGSGLINGLLVAIVLFRSSGRFIGDASLDSGPVQLKGEQLNETSE
jgi:hypothetical protein